MTLQLIALAQPETIELPVKVKTAANFKDSFLVGFKCYTREESDSLLRQMQQNLPEFHSAPEGDKLTPAQMQENEELARQFEAFTTDFIKQEVVFLKNVSFKAKNNETGKEILVKVNDTRLETVKEGLWDTADECLAVLLNFYLSYTSYKSSFYKQLHVALANSNYDNELLKN